MREHSIMEFAMVFGLIVVSIVAVDQAIKTHRLPIRTVRVSTTSKVVPTKKASKSAAGKASSVAPVDTHSSSKAVDQTKASTATKHPEVSTAISDDDKH